MPQACRMSRLQQLRSTLPNSDGLLVPAGRRRSPSIVSASLRLLSAVDKPRPLSERSPRPIPGRPIGTSFSHRPRLHLRLRSDRQAAASGMLTERHDVTARLCWKLWKLDSRTEVLISASYIIHSPGSGASGSLDIQKFSWT